RITSPALSADGKWMTFTYTPNEGGQTIVHVKSLDGGPDYHAVVGGGSETAAGGGAPGAPGGGGTEPSFSDDSHWAVYLVRPQGRAGAGRGGRGRGNAPAPGARTATAGEEGAAAAHLELLNLTTGDKVAIPGASSWKFAKGSRWLAIKLAPADVPAAGPEAPAGGRGGRGGAAGGRGAAAADLVVRDMRTGAVRNIGNVADFEFDHSGALIAYTVDAPD